MTDTERLDALQKYGLCVTMHAVLTVEGWIDIWVCNYGMKTIMAPTIREVIDAAVLDITCIGGEKH